MIAEIFAKDTGICRGMGGSPHVADFSKGIIGANGIVGGGIPIGLGAALAAQLEKGSGLCLFLWGWCRKSGHAYGIPQHCDTLEIAAGSRM